MQGSAMGDDKGLPSAYPAAAMDGPKRWSRRLIMPLLTTAGLLLGVGILVAWTGTGSIRPSVMYSALSAKMRPPPQTPAPPFLLTDDASFRQDEIKFTWVPRVEERKELEAQARKDSLAEVVRGEGVAACDLVVEGYDMQVFEEKTAAHACLRKKSIVLVGDSLTRYQYLNLVNFIENGQWGGPDPQLENEFQWGGWPPFYEGTNARFNGREICDCYREEPASRRGNIENRYYYNEESDVWVSFFQWFRGETGHLGHDMAKLNVSLPPSRSVRAPSRRGKPKKEEKKQEKKEQQQQQQQQRTPALRPVPLPTPPLDPPAPAAPPAAPTTPTAAVAAPAPPLPAAAAAADAPPPPLTLDEAEAEATTTAAVEPTAGVAATATAAAAAAGTAADKSPPRTRQLLQEQQQVSCLPGACNQGAAAAAAAAAEPPRGADKTPPHARRHRQLLPPRDRKQTGCAPGSCNQPPDWEFDIYDFFLKVVPKLHPDVLIINSGHWARLPGEYDLARLSKVAREAVRASGGRVIWKTTTAPKEPADFIPEDDLKEHFHREGFSILDAGAITYAARAVDTQLSETQNTHLYWDMLHFYAPVYAGLNKVLLNYICPASMWDYGG